MSTVLKPESAPLKKPFYQYGDYIIIATRMIYYRAARRGITLEFNPDWLHPDLVRQLENVNTLLTDHNGLTDITVIASIVQRWEEFQHQHGSGRLSYYKSNALLTGLNQ